MKNFFSLFLLILCAGGISAQTKESKKIDEFGVLPCDEYLTRMDNAGIQGRDNSSATVYILIYEGYESRYNNRKRKNELVLLAYGSARAKILSIRKFIVRYKFPVNKFEFIEGGFRDSPGVEIWLVPAGAVPPKPTPTLAKMKYRRGKAIGFCISCCD